MKHIATRLILLALLLAPVGGFAQSTVTDSAGRPVALPATVEKAFPAGPPASVFVYMVAPDKLAGWTKAPSPDERAFLPAKYAGLPELGRLTGRGNTVNLEAVVASAPNLIVDIGTVSPTYVSLADNVQAQTRIPYALVEGRLADTPKTFRLLGSLLGASDQAEKLARYAETTLNEIKERTDRIPADRKLKVYLARGPRGLETGIQGSINVEALELAGVRNVAAESLGAGGIVNVSIEQVIAWQPDAIVTIDPKFYEAVFTDPQWQQVKAVKDKRVYLSPSLPYGWVDAPPAANRLIGLRWLAKVLYPKLFPEDLREETRRFYGLFYHQEPTGPQLDQLLAGSK